MLILSLPLLLKGCNVVLRKVKKLPIVAVIAGLLFAALVYILAWSPLFSVSSITIKGAPTPTSEKVIAQTVAVKVGDQLARVEPRAIARRTFDIDWVEKVDVSRNWITGAVTVAITPRTPAAYFNESTIDTEGKVFDLPGFNGAQLPRVSAPTSELGVAAIALFTQLPTTFRDEVLSLSARNESNFVMKIARDGRELQIVWGAPGKSDVKIQVINALLSLPENKNIRRIDVSAPHAPIVK
jgi:cell division protein FtsQ